MDFLITTGTIGIALIVLAAALWRHALCLHASKEKLRKEIELKLADEDTAHLYETLVQSHEIERDDTQGYSAGGYGRVKATKAETLGILAGVLYFGGSFILLFPYFLGTWVVGGPGPALVILFSPLVLLFLVSWISGLRRKNSHYSC